MAQWMQKEAVPGTAVVRSAIKFAPGQDEELFLLYSVGSQNGPGIERDGRSSPWMSHPSPKWSRLHVTDPDLQRWGTWFLDDTQKAADNGELQQKLNRPLPTQSTDYKDQLTDLLAKNLAEEVYANRFRAVYPDREILAIQGIGDLTMNHWNVAYLRSPFTGGQPEILHLLDEPIQDRVYSCLVKWHDQTPRYEVRDVRFNRYLYNARRDDPAVVQIDGQDVADKIEFAVYGQHVIVPGPNGMGSQVFEPSEIIHQFSDVRHLFQLPNLNPKDSRPRYYFGRVQMDDIWFGEAELLDSRNLRRAALAGSIELNRLYQGLGASLDQVSEALTKSATPYVMRPQPTGVLRYDEIPVYLDAKGAHSAAEWRSVPGDDAFIEIRLRENRYPCTMIGVDPEGAFYLYAWKGTYSAWPGLTLRQAARQLLLGGATSAILCDEGGDVFQYFNDGTGLAPVIKPGRGQVRAVFVVARPKKETKRSPNGR